MDAPLDGTHTRGMKGLPYDWQALLIPDEPDFSDAIATLLRDADSPELTADAASIMAAVRWMMEEPTRGVRVPDDLPHDRILEWARPHLGTMLSTAVDWDPLRTRRDVFDQWAPHTALHDPNDPWQFGNFLVGAG